MPYDLTKQGRLDLWRIICLSKNPDGSCAHQGGTTDAEGRYWCGYCGEQV